MNEPDVIVKVLGRAEAGGKVIDDTRQRLQYVRLIDDCSSSFQRSIVASPDGAPVR